VLVIGVDRYDTLFPAVYNEDWPFMLETVQNRSVVAAGTHSQFRRSPEVAHDFLPSGTGLQLPGTTSAYVLANDGDSGPKRWGTEANLSSQTAHVGRVVMMLNLGPGIC
jgi:hypothetical protein